MRSFSKTAQLRLIKLRWLSLLAMPGVALLSANIVGSFELVPRLLTVAAVLGVMNIALAVIARFARGKPEALPIFSPFAQLSIDLLAWACYIYLSGGATNPLITVFLPLVAIGALVLGRVQAWLLGGMAIFAYTYLWRYYQPLAIDNALTATRLHVFGMWLVFVVSAVVVVWFILQMTDAIGERDAALADAREQAIRNDWLVSMGSLAASTAHQLSTPLGTLNIVVDDLLDEPDVPAALRPDLELMRRQIDVCKLALNQLAQRAGYRGDERMRLPAATWLRRVIDAWLGLNPSANVSVQLAPNLDRNDVAFDLSVERALCNLFDNAQRAGATQIVVSATRAQRELVVCVDDDGAGISSRALKSFGAGQPVTSEQGMGVGLLLGRVALERVGGALRFVAKTAPGTRVQLTLPLSEPKDLR